MTAALPTFALSVQQPWAWLIVHGRKDIENRSWSTGRRGSTLIHAGKVRDREASDLLGKGLHPVTGEGWDAAIDAPAHAGGIVGVADIVDCVTDSDSPCFVGRYGFVLANARPLPFMPCRGMLGFFPVTYRKPGA